jgi:hypothetical protein
MYMVNWDKDNRNDNSQVNDNTKVLLSLWSIAEIQSEEKEQDTIG